MRSGDWGSDVCSSDLHEGQVLMREDLGDDALVAVAAGLLVGHADLALLAHVDADKLVHAGRQLVAVLPGEDLHVDDLADLAVGHLEAGVANLTGLLTEDGAQQALLGGELGLALRRDLADGPVRSEELRVGTGWVRTVKSRGATAQKKKKQKRR